MTEQIEIKPIKEKLATSAFMNLYGYNHVASGNPWSPDQIDRMEAPDMKDFIKVINACRFFYRHDPIVSSVFNKMIDIGINEINFDEDKLSANERKIVSYLKVPFQEFAETMALEFLISGLVVPEIKVAAATKEELKKFGIKKYESLQLPVAMWLRDPATIKINSSAIMGSPSYYVKIPDEMISFIMHEGTYSDGTKDPELWAQLKMYYPEFITQVKGGVKEILLDNPLIINRRPLSDSPYPTPYLYSVLEPLKHKRNLRRMDYSIAARVISAIQVFKLGNDMFPVTEEQGDQFDSIKNQMYWRNTSGQDVERIFQLFTNHTLQIEWVLPPIEALISEKKYDNINQDILYGLGFSNILLTGEAQRSASTSAELSMISPTRTMMNMRYKILKVLNSVLQDVFINNNLKGETECDFKSINLVAFNDFVTGLSKLYDSGNLSRRSYADAFGYDFDDEMVNKDEENTIMKDLKLGEFAPAPFSPAPNTPGNSKNESKPVQTKPSGEQSPQ